MTNSYTQNKNENVIYREKRKTISTKGNFETLGLYEKIIKELNKSEKIYAFPESDVKISRIIILFLCMMSKCIYFFKRWLLW